MGYKIIKIFEVRYKVYLDCLSHKRQPYDITEAFVNYNGAVEIILNWNNFTHEDKIWN